MTYRRGFLAAIALIAIVSGCSSAKRPVASEPVPAAKSAVTREAPGGGLAGLTQGATTDSANVARQPAAAPRTDSPTAPATRDRYIIRRATLALEVTHVREALDRIGALARVRGGFVSDSSLDASEGQAPSARLTLRVPAEQFDPLLNALGGIGSVRTRQVTGEDVTTAFVDTSSQVRNLQHEEAQLLKLVERSGRLADVLMVERELVRVRGEIERAQGQLRHMGHMVELATIEIAIAEPAQVANASPWQLQVLAHNAWLNTQRELATTLGMLVGAAIWVVGFLLPLLVPALLLYLLAGRALAYWLVDRQQWLSSTRFAQAWAAFGLALVLMAWPAAAGLVLLAGAIAMVGWLVVGLRGRLSRPAAPPPARS